MYPCWAAHPVHQVGLGFEPRSGDPKSWSRGGEPGNRHPRAWNPGQVSPPRYLAEWALWPPLSGPSKCHFSGLPSRPLPRRHPHFHPSPGQLGPQAELHTLNRHLPRARPFVRDTDRTKAIHRLPNPNGALACTVCAAEPCSGLSPES